MPRAWWADGAASDQGAGVGVRAGRPPGLGMSTGQCRSDALCRCPWRREGGVVRKFLIARGEGVGVEYVEFMAGVLESP
jgi:hypothetical protein